MYHVTEYNSDTMEVEKAYTTTAFPDGRIIGKDGNAALLEADDCMIVVSRPVNEGLLVLPKGTQSIDLSWAFES